MAKNVTPTASTPQALATAVGTTYDKGKTDAHAETWTVTFNTKSQSASYGKGVIPLHNVTAIIATTSSSPTYFQFYKSDNSTTGHMKVLLADTPTDLEVNSNDCYLEFWRDGHNVNVTLQITYRNQKIK